MSDEALQIIARGPRAVAETAAAAIDETPDTETLTYSILEEDEDHDVWRIDAFPTSAAERQALLDLLAQHGELLVTTEKLADADWLAMALSAARTGSTVALGSDVDPVSVRIANENAALNRANARFVHAAGLNDPKVRAGGPYALVFANILAPPLVALAQDIKRALAPG